MTNLARHDDVQLAPAPDVTANLCQTMAQRQSGVLTLDDLLAESVVQQLSELVARLEALLRPVVPRDTILRVGPLKLDLLARMAFRGHRELELLPREFQLLEYMMRREGQVLTRAMLLKHVWNYRFVPRTNLVDVHIGRLRRKLDGPNEMPMILSVRGAGFVLHAPS